jgi:hypothetical protein
MSIGLMHNHRDWAIAKQEIYDACNWDCSIPIIDAESKEYAACSFTLNNRPVLYREAKITPTKIGLFVTIWKRLNNGPTSPYNEADVVDFFIITTREKNRLGQFIFPKSILIAKGILSTPSKEGKRGFRVYPPWCETISEQAQATQKWQSTFFIDILPNLQSNLVRAKTLLPIIS